MTTVFLSGSRTLGRLNSDVRERLRNIVDQNFHVVIGDAARSFVSVATAEDIRKLLTNCSPEAQSQINKKIKLTKSLDQLERSSQGSLAI